MIRTYLLAGILILGCVSQASAATFYVAKGTTTHQCRIVTTKPDGKTMIMIGTVDYKTRSGAVSALKASPECKKK